VPWGAEGGILGSAAFLLKHRRPDGSLSVWQKILLDFKTNWGLLLMFLPVLVYYLMFSYAPMYGLQIAFKDYTMSEGILKSPWIGFRHFTDFFSSIYFGRLLRNTFVISFMDIVLGFPVPVIFALLLNELRGSFFKRTVQTISYMPHFISTVVIAGMIIDFCSRRGVINIILGAFNIGPIIFLTEAKWFPWVYVLSGIWQQFGWSSIVYLGALTAIDPQLYEAASIDGAGLWNKLVHITLASLLPTIMIMLILRMGHAFSIGAEKILLLYNGATYETADVIATYVYRKGLQEASYSFSAAVGFFNSIINFIMLISFNRISKKFTEVALF
jgi:putative aldouronate transport system permease protein